VPAVALLERTPVDAASAPVQPAAVDPTTTRVQLTGARGRLAGRAVATSAPATSLLTPALSTAAYQTVGVTWDPGQRADLRIAVRTRGGGTWSAWTDLDESDAGQPDGAVPLTSIRGGTDPLWAGPSDGVQVRVAAESGRLPAGLRAELVDPGRSPYDALAGGGGPGESATVAMVGAPRILSRRAWGANESRVRAAPTIMPTIAAAAVHHTAGKNGYGPSQVPGIIRGDYSYHLSRGWNDIGYNFLVDRFGRVWEGRGGGVARPVMGAHTGGFNTHTVGVAVLGNLDVARPTAATAAGIARLVSWKLDLHHRDPLGSTILTARGTKGTTSRYKDGQQVRKPVIMGHRDVGYTACPGRYLYPWLPGIRRNAARLMKAGLLEPRLTTASRTYGTGGTALVVTSLAAQRWRLVVREACSGRVVATAGGRSGARTRFAAAWSGRDARTGRFARPGRYVLQLTAASSTGTARPVTSALLVLPRTPAPPPSGPMSTGAGRYVPITPARLLDTRGTVTPLGPRGRVDVRVLGRGGVPAADVSSVVVQTTAVCATGGTALRVYPTGARAWGTHALHATRPGTPSATSVVPVGADGRISIGNDLGVTDVLVDVIGYHTTATAAGSGLVALDRQRIYDSRRHREPLGGGASRSITAGAGAGLQPADLSAQFVSVTVFRSPSAGVLELRGGTGTAGPAVRVRYPAGRTHDERVLVPVSGGVFTVRNTGRPVHFAIDAVGSYPLPGAGGGAVSGAPVTGIAPVRALDSRLSGSGYLPSGGFRTIQVAGTGGVPADATHVLVNLVGLHATAATRLAIWPAGTTGDGGTDLRAPAGDVRAGLVLARVGSGGRIVVGTRDAPVKVVTDVVGWYR
jgi:hypothetical protein